MLQFIFDFLWKENKKYTDHPQPENISVFLCAAAEKAEAAPGELKIL